MKFSHFYYIEKIQDELKKYGQACKDNIDGKLIKPSEVNYSPDLVFLNSETDKGLLIEFKMNKTNGSLPISQLLAFNDYKEKIESVNVGFRYVIVSFKTYNKVVIRYFDKISITYLSMEEMEFEDLISTLVDLTRD